MSHWLLYRLGSTVKTQKRKNDMQLKTQVTEFKVEANPV